MSNTVYTIGHSTREIEDFTNLLANNGITLLVDVRRYPHSPKFPQFDIGNLHESLQEKGIEYTHLEALGGRRRPEKNSVNTRWRSKSFQGYADYMSTEEFAAAAKQLESLAETRIVAYMCSEVLWWRCHRALISDWMAIRGWEVKHILSENNIQPHRYSAAAIVEDGRLRYSDQPHNSDQ